MAIWGNHVQYEEKNEWIYLVNPIYGQYQFAIIGRIPLYLEDVVFDFKLSSVFLGINLTIALDGFFLCQKTIYHIFGKPNDSA